MKAIRIYGWEIPIVKQKGLTDAHGVLGFYDYTTKTIVIDASLKKADYMATLLHEVVHALFHRGGLHQTKIPTSVEEIICEQVSTVLIENFNLTAKRRR